MGHLRDITYCVSKKCEFRKKCDRWLPDVLNESKEGWVSMADFYAEGKQSKHMPCEYHMIPNSLQKRSFVGNKIQHKTQPLVRKTTPIGNKIKRFAPIPAQKLPFIGGRTPTVKYSPETYPPNKLPIQYNDAMNKIIKSNKGKHIDEMLTLMLDEAIKWKVTVKKAGENGARKCGDTGNDRRQVNKTTVPRGRRRGGMGKSV